MHKVLLASNNHGKLREIQAILADSEFELVTPDQIGLDLAVAETGKTYRENAALKANAFATAAGMLAMADDSGLEVDALDGQPGLHSARFSPLAGATDADRRLYLLQKLAGKPRPWAARFHCTIALALPNGAMEFADGYCPGEIIPNERGQNGFGYDPIFLVHGTSQTMAELSMDAKNQVSHRARAVRAALPLLRALGKSPF